MQPVRDLEEWDGVDGPDHHPCSSEDLMFDQWVDLSASRRSSITPIFQLVLEELKPEGRKARSDLIEGIETIVSTLMANLVVLNTKRSAGARLVLEMGRRKRTRYDRNGLRKMPVVINVLERAGLLVLHPAVFKKLRTTIEPAEKLKSIIERQDIGLTDVIRAEGEELIVLNARPDIRYVGGQRKPNVLVDYEDTEETRRLRAEVEEINRFLSSRSILLEGSPQPAFRLHRKFTLRNKNDPGAFNLHGRLYGGFWMTLKATERHRLRIDGEPIADLDFSSMFPRLAYHHVGKEPPEGDLYAIPGLENHRDSAKTALSALLSYGDEMKSLPPRLKERLPEGWTASRIKQAVASFHPDLVPLFGRDFGLDLMFTESRILLAALRRLMAKKIPALPMHDGIMVPRSKAAEGVAAMEQSATDILGRSLPVEIKNS